MRAAVVQPLSAARWLLILIVAAGVYFFHGFLVPVLAALVIGFASWPLYREADAGASAATARLPPPSPSCLILAFLVVPIALAGTYAIHEVREWLTWALETNRNGAPTPHWIAVLPVVGEWLERAMDRAISAIPAASAK